MHLPKATTRAKEEPKSWQEIGRPRILAASSWIKAPGAKERPGITSNAMRPQEPEDHTQGNRGGTIKRLSTDLQVRCKVQIG